MILTPTTPGTLEHGHKKGIVFTKGPWGQAARARSSHTINRSAATRPCQAATAAVCAGWVETLTDPQRATWDTYAVASPVVNRAGRTITLSGEQMYVRNARLHRRAGLPLPTIAPPTTGHPTASLTDVWVTITSLIVLTLSLADPWTTQSGAFCFVTDHGPQPPTRHKLRHGGRAAGSIAGVPVTGPTNPTSIARPWLAAARTAGTITIQVLDALGRVSNPVTYHARNIDL